MTAANLQLILGSGSPRRRALLAEAGYRFRVVPPDPQAECGLCSGATPAAVVAERAYRKAADVRRRVPTGTVIGCDTVAECQGRILGKPLHIDDAREMLENLSGKEHRVFSGLCVWHAAGPAPNENPRQEVPGVRVAVTTLRMDRLTETQLDEYLESHAWEGKAGAFGYQDRLGWVHIVQGSPSNVVGLPLELLAEMLRDHRKSVDT